MSVQILNWSATEPSGREVGNDAVRSRRLRHWPQMETKVVGFRSRTDETLAGIETPDFSSVFTSISCDSSICFPFGWASKKLRLRGFLRFVCDLFTVFFPSVYGTNEVCFRLQRKRFLPLSFEHGVEGNSRIYSIKLTFFFKICIRICI